MNAKQERFVQEYLVDLNATQAAKRSGISFCAESKGGFYVYFLCDSRDGRIFYIGKGHGDRLHDHVRRCKHQSRGAKNKKIKEIQAVGAVVQEVILEDGLEEDIAFALEESLIYNLKDCGICNVLGGDDDELNARQRAFVNAYAGNATEAAIKAGYSKKTARQQGAYLLSLPDIKEALVMREKIATRSRIATRQQRQEFWTEMMLDTNVKLRDRLRASELLAKSEADFIEKIEATVNLTPADILKKIEERRHG